MRASALLWNYFLPVPEDSLAYGRIYLTGVAALWNKSTRYPME